MNLKIHITKWVSGEIATGSVMVKKERKHSKYPMCHEINETTGHILQCKSNDIQKLHTNLLIELKLWMTTVQTHPEISKFLCEELKYWLQTDEYEIDHNSEANIKLAYRTQVLIGWESLLHGFLSTKIVQCQQQHYTSLESRKLGTR